MRWFLLNSEDVGNIASMLILAMSVGFGVTDVMLYLFAIENLPQYAVLSAMGTRRDQAGVSALNGTGLGLSMCAIAGGRFGAQLTERSFFVRARVVNDSDVNARIAELFESARRAWPVLPR